MQLNHTDWFTFFLKVILSTVNALFFLFFTTQDCNINNIYS